MNCNEQIIRFFSVCLLKTFTRRNLTSGHGILSQFMKTIVFRCNLSLVSNIKLHISKFYTVHCPSWNCSVTWSGSDNSTWPSGGALTWKQSAALQAPLLGQVCRPLLHSCVEVHRSILGYHRPIVWPSPQALLFSNNTIQTSIFTNFMQNCNRLKGSLKHMRFSQLLLLSYMPHFATPMELQKDLWPVYHNFFFTDSG